MISTLVITNILLLIAVGFILKELHAMSANSDRLTASVETLTATVNNVVIPALQGDNSGAAAAEAALGTAADSVDALNGQILAAHTAAAPAPPVEEPVAQ